MNTNGHKPAVANREEVMSWFQPIVRGAGQFEVVDDTDKVLRVKLYTDRYQYCINVHWDTNYLGTSVDSRKPRAGEFHTRGNDLADGPLNIGTWHDILANIVAYEAVALEGYPAAYKGLELTADGG